MTVKEYLREGYNLAKGIRYKRERIRQLRELAESSHATYSFDRVDSTPHPSRLENCICQIDEWERAIDADLGKIRKIRACFSRVKDVEQRQLLELRYVDGYTWEEISERMHYSERKIFYIHGGALQSVQCFAVNSVLK